MLLSEGQLNDHVGARLMFDAMPRAKVLIADKGYDSDDFREALEECGVVIPPFLVGWISRIYAALFSFWAGVMPPMPMLGRSLLYVQSHCVA